MKHKGECMANSDTCFGYSKSGHKIRECPATGRKGKYFCQVGQSNFSCTLVGHLTQKDSTSSTTSRQHQNCLYALQTRLD